jgi:hypothetical protein
MFVYINENFLHAPSTDLSKEVVKLLVGLMVAQASEVFVETMGPATGKSAGLRSKLCMQVSSAYAALVEDVKEWHTKGVFLREWSLLIQVRHFSLLYSCSRQSADRSAHTTDQSQVLWLARSLPPVDRRHERRQIRRSSRPPPSRREPRQGGQSPCAALHVDFLDDLGRQLVAG